MSYCDTLSLFDWLIIDDTSRVIAKCANESIANITANALAARAERARKHDHEVGDVIPLFHV